MRLDFEGEVIHWRGPSPYYFVGLPEPLCDDLRIASRDVSYGWGVIPVTVRIGGELLKARVPVPFRLGHDSTVYVGFNQNRLHLFKASDGTALHAPQRA